MEIIFGIENIVFKGKTEKEAMRLYIENQGVINENIEKSEPIRQLCVRLNKISNERIAQKAYGVLFKEMFITLRCYKDDDDFFGKIILKFSKVHQGVHATYVFPLDDFLKAGEEMRKYMVLKGITESIVAISKKKKGDFNAGKLIQDIEAVFKKL